MATFRPLIPRPPLPNYCPPPALELCRITNSALDLLLDSTSVVGRQFRLKDSEKALDGSRFFRVCGVQIYPNRLFSIQYEGTR